MWDSSGMSDRRSQQSDGYRRRENSRPYVSNDRQNRQDFTADRSKTNFTQRNFSQHTGGDTGKNFKERYSSPGKNFGDRAGGPSKNFGDRTGAPFRNFDERQNFPKKTDSVSSPPQSESNSCWDGDKSQDFGPRKTYNDATPNTRTSPLQTKEDTNMQASKTAPLTNYNSTTITEGTYKEVYVSHVVNPGEFYCQSTEEKSKLPAMMEKLFQKYAAVNDNEQRLESASVGQPCCAIYSGDGCWYRGKIIGTDFQSRPSAFNVFFVDYGNAEKVPASKVKRLDAEFFSWPPQALKCALFNILPQSGSWSEEDNKTFMDMALDKCFVAKFEQINSDGIYMVNLLNINKLKDDIINKDFTTSGHGRLADANKLLVINSQVASTNLNFASPDIQENATEEVIVTWVVNPVEFYCQLKSFASIFNKMMKDLQSHYGKATDINDVIDRPQPGMICIAQFTEDQAWYRAKIVSVEKNMVDVYYVDYGNSEQVSKKKVKYIHQDFTIHPVQGIKCHLGGVKLSGESLISQSVGEKYFGGKTMCTFLRNVDGAFHVTLLNDSKNVAKELVHNQVVLPEPQFSSSIGAAGGDVNEFRGITSCSIPKNQVVTSPGTLLSVSIPFIESPCQFWCNLLDSADQLGDLMDSIDAHYSSTDIPSLVDIKVDCGCVAKYSEDERWYRAVVKNILEDSCEVFFVDYGNTDIVKSSDVKMIDPKFCNLPAQAMECKLHGVPNSISSEATMEFMKVLDSEELLAKVERAENEVLVVTLLDSSGEDEINVGESLFGPISEQQVVVLESKVPAFSKPAIPIGVQSGYISYVNDPSDFYVQLEDVETELSDFAAELSDKYESFPESDSIAQNVCVGMACCAKFTDDNQWYRAEVIDIADSSATVLFVDYGNTDVVQTDSLKTLTEDYLKKLPYAIHCKLAGVMPSAGDTWSAEAITVFEQTTSDALLTITFSVQTLPAPVTVVKDEENVAEQLANSQLCRYNKTEAPNSINLKATEGHLITSIDKDTARDVKFEKYPERAVGIRTSVKLSFTYSVEKFFVTPVELVEQLESITDRLQESYNTDCEDTTCSVDVGQPCVARYSDDMAWYRAVVTGIQGDEITVLFVDFGNSEVTETSSLRPLTPEFLEIPPVAIECSLFGLKVLPGKEDEIAEKLEAFVDNEVEFEMEVVESQQPFKIQLKSERDLAEQLIEEGLAEYLPSVSDIVDSEQVKQELEVLSSPPSASETNGTPTHICMQSVSVGEIAASVKYVEISNGLITLHVVPSEFADALTRLQDCLEATYGQSERSVPGASSKYCAAKAPDDECWYRAEILKQDEESYYVKFLDYGNCETVSPSDVAELLPGFSVEHQYSLSCCMFGMSVLEENKEAAENRIYELTGDKHITLKISCVTPDALGMCWALASVDGMDIMQTLSGEELVSCVWPPAQLPGEEFEAEIENIETENLLLCVIPTEWADERSSFINELQEMHKNNAEPLASNDIKSGILCAVDFNEKWFRGYIMNAHEESIVVYFVDHGYARTVTSSCVKALHPNFCQRASLILRCTLYDWVHPVNDNIYKKMFEICMSRTVKCTLHKSSDAAFEPFSICMTIDGSDVLSSMVQFINGENADGLCPSDISVKPAEEILEEVDNTECFATDHNVEAPVSEMENSDYPNSTNVFGDENFDEVCTQMEFDASVEDDLGKPHLSVTAFPDSIETEHSEMQKYPERAVSNNSLVKLSYVYSHDKFYVTPIELREQLDQITSCLEEKYSAEEEYPLCTVQIMQPCVAQYSEDATWYRALIIDVKENEVLVLFVDFGNTEVIEHSSLRAVSPELWKIPPLAVECSLFGIQVIPEKVEEINSRLTTLLEDEVEFELEIIENHEPYKVKLKGDTDLAEQFIAEGLAESYVPPSQKLQDSETFKENLRIAFLEEPLSLEDKGFIPYQNVSRGEISADIKHIELCGNTVMFHAVPSNLEDALTNLQEKLQIAYSDSNNDAPLQPELKFCAAKSSEDGLWYRAQILRKCDSYDVKFVDYGNCETISPCDVRELPPEFLTQNQYSIACYLSAVRVIPGKEEDVEPMISDLISEKEVMVDIYDVTLSTTGTCRATVKIHGTDIIHVLIQGGLTFQAYPVPRPPSATFDAQVEGVKLESQIMFYIIPKEWLEARRVFQEELCKSCESVEPVAPSAISSDSLYVTVFDEQWCRVSVINVGEDSVVANSIDYGNIKTVSKSSLWHLEPKFYHKPRFVLLCLLSGWSHPLSESLCSKFQEICSGKAITCKIQQTSHDSEPFPVNVEVDGTDIMLCLTDHEKQSDFYSEMGMDDVHKSMVISPESLSQDECHNKFAGKETVVCESTVVSECDSQPKEVPEKLDERSYEFPASKTIMDEDFYEHDQEVLKELENNDLRDDISAHQAGSSYLESSRVDDMDGIEKEDTDSNLYLSGSEREDLCEKKDKVYVNSDTSQSDDVLKEDVHQAGNLYCTEKEDSDSNLYLSGSEREDVCEKEDRVHVNSDTNQSDDVLKEDVHQAGNSYLQNPKADDMDSTEKEDSDSNLNLSSSERENVCEKDDRVYVSSDNSQSEDISKEDAMLNDSLDADQFFDAPEQDESESGAANVDPSQSHNNIAGDFDISTWEPPSHTPAQSESNVTKYTVDVPSSESILSNTNNSSGDSLAVGSISNPPDILQSINLHVADSSDTKEDSLTEEASCVHGVEKEGSRIDLCLTSSVGATESSQRSSSTDSSGIQNTDGEDVKEAHLQSSVNYKDAQILPDSQLTGKNSFSNEKCTSEEKDTGLSEPSSCNSCCDPDTDSQMHPPVSSDTTCSSAVNIPETGISNCGNIDELSTDIKAKEALLANSCHSSENVNQENK